MLTKHLAGYSQQDAHEYMQFMLNSLHTTNVPTTDSSTDSPDRNCDCIIHSTFCGKLASTVTCDECKNKTITIEPFMDLSLDLRIAVQKKRKLNGAIKEKESKDDEGEMKLEECLRRFTFVEKLAREEYTCRKCEKQRDATKQLSVKRLPPVLSIHLKVCFPPPYSESGLINGVTIMLTLVFLTQRFSTTKSGSASSKLETPVHFPISLDMAPYTTSYKPDDSDDAPPEANYTLSAVIVHKGEINSGHYVSYAREGREWFLFDDSKVVLVGEGEVLAAQAYLLIYVAETF
jgi:ubiquitin carboxyl-terminal hydrolase 22/27/51